MHSGGWLMQILFYHSNTKVPGVFAIAEVEKEGYPDCECGVGLLILDTAWDEYAGMVLI